MTKKEAKKFQIRKDDDVVVHLAKLQLLKEVITPIAQRTAPIYYVCLPLLFVPSHASVPLKRRR